MVAQHSGPVSVLKQKDKKRSDNDFNLPWTGNKNEANEMWTGEAKAYISSRLQQKHGWS